MNRYPDLMQQQIFTYQPNYQFQDHQEKKEVPLLLREQLMKQQQIQEAPQAINQVKQIQTQDLEAPIQSLPFLEHYHKSAQTVQSLGQTLNKFSVYLGITSAAMLAYSVCSFMSTGSDQSNRYRLGATQNSDSLLSSDGNINYQYISQTFSIFIWGIVLAKAKTGLQAANSKETTTVNSAFKKVVTLLVLVSLASLAKFNADNNLIEKVVTNAPLLQQPMKQQRPNVIDYNELRKSVVKKNKKVLQQGVPTMSRETQFKVGSSVFVGAFIIVYATIFKNYQKAVDRHQKLTNILNHPKAKVASGEKAYQILQQAKQKVEPSQNRLVQLQQNYMPVNQVMPPTLQNLPPTQRDQNNYNYSLCDSIDYQIEPILQDKLLVNNLPHVLPKDNTDLPSANERPHLENQKKLEQLKQMREKLNQDILQLQNNLTPSDLNQQPIASERSKVINEPNIVKAKNDQMTLINQLLKDKNQNQNVIVMSKEEFLNKIKKNDDISLNSSLLSGLNSEISESTFKITSKNQME